MPSSSRLPSLFDKLDELRAVFLLSRRSLPSLEELLCFVQDTALLLEEVDASIRARTGTMPRAASQLKSVSEATELATTEILDLADEALDELRALGEPPAALSEHLDAFAAADARLLALLRAELGPDQNALLARVGALCDEKRALRQAVRGDKQRVHEALTSVRARIHRITMALQVQDITAQQLASVNHLIESVRARMDQLLTRISSASDRNSIPDASPSSRPPSGEAPAAEASAQAPLPFDEKASYDHAPGRQQRADALVAFFHDDGVAGTSGAPAALSELAPSPPENEVPETSQDADRQREAASQADIDQLFQQGL